MILLKAAFSCMLMKFLLAIVLLLLPAMAEAADITGVPKIREGDQIMIGSSRIRLGGIDAPSVDQLCLNNTGERWTCGVAARDALIHHTDKKSWTCHVLRTEPRGRNVAHCTVDGEDIQKWLVASGWALSYARFSHDYDADEIKGNINGAGECIYHTPKSRWYAKIKMQISKGTRWFCSVEEAEQAGCRETRR
jgi:endonuclease YncB( thermonuclease family)